MNHVYKFTVILLFIIVNSVPAQIRPSSAAERLNGLQKRKLPEDINRLKELKFRKVRPGILSGRAVDVDVNPAGPTEFYVPYASGGTSILPIIVRARFPFLIRKMHSGGRR